jgi:signal peptidase I
MIKVKMKSEKNFFKYICIGIALGLFLKFFVVDIFSVSGISMEPAIRDNEKIVVNKIAYGIVNPFGNSTFIRWRNAKSGDAVLYVYKNNFVVKRCVATEGDSLVFSHDSRYTLRVREKSYPLTEIQFHLLKNNPAVPQGMILAIGDNAENSIDSRNYGFVSQKNILGRVIFK